MTAPATAQITMDQLGNLGIGTSTDGRYKLKILCDTGNDCADFGQGGVGIGLEVISEGSVETVGIIGKAKDGALINYGIWGFASGANSYAGRFNGDVFISGSLNQSSDERLKTNIRPLYENTAAISLLTQLEPRRFEFRDESEVRQQGLPWLNTKDGEYYGFVAQEMERILPELVSDIVHMAEDENGQLIGGNTVTTRAVRYNELIPVLVAGFQEQQVLIEELKTHNEELEARIEALENQMQE